MKFGHNLSMWPRNRDNSATYTRANRCGRTALAVWALGFVVALAGCAQTSTPNTTQALKDNRVNMVEVLTIGYNSIDKKYIRPVTVAEVASEGLRGLGGIDPMVAVVRSSDKIVLTFEGRRQAAFAVAGDHAVEEWVDLSLSIIDRAKAVSPILANADNEAIFEALFDGALSNLDIFSRYAGRDEARDNRARRDGFGGVGIKFRMRDGRAMITEVMPGTPAGNAGLLAGDAITHVGAVPVDGMTSRDIARQLRGPVNSAIAITLSRGDENKVQQWTLVRSHIIPKTVFTTFDNGVMMARVTNFNQNTTRSMREVLTQATERHGSALKGVVLDLRGNPGGLLSQSIKMADLFLTDGEIISTRGRHRDAFQHYTAHGRDVIGGRPLVILVDGKSASAAEVTAATLQDRGRAVVMGTTSFGKGSVQTVVRLPNSGEMTLTWSHLIAPSGYAFHGLGLLPSFCTSGVEAKLSKDDLAALDLNAKEFQVLGNLIEGLRTRITAQEWRLPGIDDEVHRKDLRTECPPQRRKSRAIDGQLARYLIADPSLYAHAVGGSATTAAAN